MTKLFNAENIDLSHFHPVRVVYPPKALYTEGIQITIQNIGALALEFEAELVNNALVLMLERTDEHDQKVGAHRIFHLDDWIVPLWGELHKFQNDIFKNTFHFVDEEPGKLVPTPGNPTLFAPIAGLWSDGDMTFRVNDRVRVISTGHPGKVVTVDVAGADGSFGLEVLMDTGEYFIFGAKQLMPDDFQPESGIIEGEHGTQIMPRIED